MKKDFMKIVNDISNKIDEMANIIENDEATMLALSEESAELREAIEDCNYVLASWLYLESFLF